MKVTSKDLSDTKVEIKVVLDKKDLAEARKKAVARMSAEVKVQGFRKGKAPISVAEKQLDPNDINANALDIAVRTSVPKAFEQAKKAPLIIPNVNVTKFVPGELAEYTATADILPAVKLGNYKKLGVKLEAPKVTAKEVDDVLSNIAKAYAEKAPVKRAAKIGDEVTIDFEGKKGDKAFDGGSAKDYRLELGSGAFIPGFEDGVVGHEAGDRFDIKLTFPKDYHNAELADEKATFNVLLKQVTELKKPAYDDAFAKKCGPFKNMDELKADIKKNLTAQSEYKANEKFKDDLIRKLVEKSTVSAPEVMVSDQMHFIRDDITRNAQSQGLTFEDYLKQTGQSEPDWEKEATAVAELRVKSSLCLQVLARDEKITVPDKDVDAKLAELREVYKKSPEAMKQLKDPNVRQDVKNRMIIDKTLDFLVNANK